MPSLRDFTPPRAAITPGHYFITDAATITDFRHLRRYYCRHQIAAIADTYY
jgi:hypothetical protein